MVKNSILLPPSSFSINGVESSIEQRMAYYGVPGASIVVIQNRKICWSQQYGVTNTKTNNKVEASTLFQAASISKPVTAMTTLKLMQEEKLNIDQPANQYLTSWAIADNQYSQSSPVLVKQLLNHSSGLSVHGFAGYQVAEAIPSLIEVLNGHSVAGFKKVNSDPIVIANIPGKNVTYSGGGYCVLQQLLVDIERTDFVTLMENNVLTPLDMQDSTYQQPLEALLSALAATGHPQKDSPLQGHYHIYPEQAAAGLWTTAEDLSKFVIDIQMSLLNDSGKVLSKESAEKMTAASIDPTVGLGLFLNAELDGNKGYFLHDGWNEGFSSTLIGHKTEGYGVIILTNANQPAFNNEIVVGMIEKYGWQKI